MYKGNDDREQSKVMTSIHTLKVLCSLSSFPLCSYVRPKLHNKKNCWSHSHILKSIITNNRLQQANSFNSI